VVQNAIARRPSLICLLLALAIGTVANGAAGRASTRTLGNSYIDAGIKGCMMIRERAQPERYLNTSPPPRAARLHHFTVSSFLKIAGMPVAVPG
jgi:hypothetical protein